MMKFYVVFDTNVIVSALLTSHPDSPTATLLNMVLEDGTLVPISSNFNPCTTDSYIGKN
jgi:predicted nucleic acid-binding protein